MILNNVKFQGFYYDSNLYFGRINTIDDIYKIFKEYEGYLTPEEVLTLSYVDNSAESHSYGMRIEHDGDKTLKEFLTEYSVI